MNDLIKLAVDAYKGSVDTYSVSDAQETLRKALVEANGGSTKMDLRAIRDGKCVGVFAIVEEIIKATVDKDLKENDFFNTLVDYRNATEGDQLKFEIDDEDTLFFVDEIAKGTQGIRRQRIAGLKEVTIPTVVHGIRIYEELSRVLAGRVDFNALIEKVAKSVQHKILEEVYALWMSATNVDLGGTTAGAEYFPAVGSYNEATLLDVIEHVEAAAGGMTATIIGTKKALRNLMSGIVATTDEAKSDMYNEGYLGKFYGSPVIMVPQRHKAGSTQFVFDDNAISIVAGGQKPIKCVHEGDPLIIYGNPENNADLTQEYFLAEQWGMGLVIAANTGIGKYEIQ